MKTPKTSVNCSSEIPGYRSFEAGPWLKYTMISVGTIISLPWALALLPNAGEIIDFWDVATRGADTYSSMTFDQMILLVVLLAGAALPLAGIIYLLVTVLFYPFDRDQGRLRRMANVLWIKTALPLALAILSSLFTGQTEWGSSGADLALVFLNPLSGFWVYSPLLGLAAIAVITVPKRHKIT